MKKVEKPIKAEKAKKVEIIKETEKPVKVKKTEKVVAPAVVEPAKVVEKPAKVKKTEKVVAPAVVEPAEPTKEIEVPKKKEKVKKVEKAKKAAVEEHKSLKSDQVIEFSEEAITFPELDEAYIGVARMAPAQSYAAYDKDLVYKLMEQTKGLIEFAADEYFEKHYNIGGEGPVFMKLTEEISDLSDINPEAQLPAECFKAFIGIAYKKDEVIVGVVDLHKCVKIIAEEHTDVSEGDGIDIYAQALEYLEYNSTCAYVGPTTPYYFEQYVSYDN